MEYEHMIHYCSFPEAILVTLETTEYRFTSRPLTHSLNISIENVVVGMSVKYKNITSVAN
jgi:hypothetical protein